MTSEIEVDLEALGSLSAEALVAWAFRTYGRRAAIGTGLQPSGSVLVAMAAAARDAEGLPIRVFTVDTLRLFPETHETIRALEKRFGLEIERVVPGPERIERMVRRHGELLFFDSKAKQEYCCRIRKVEPNERMLRELDCWITGLRRDQSEGRRGTPKAEWVKQDGRKILKLAPLADWDEKRVRAYLKEHDVPYHPLFDRGYRSVGCVICTTPVLPGEDPRAGRWRWQNAVFDETAKECGIHLGGATSEGGEGA